MTDLIYFDNNSTTRLDEDVLESMLPYFTLNYGNASSQHHFGLEIHKKVEQARSVIADLINCLPGELIFTSGATESINIALKGIALHEKNGRNKIITTCTEHKAVLDTCDYLEQIGFEIVRLPVNNLGLLDIEALFKTIDDDTIAVCVMLVNNETGVIQPIAEISDFCRKKNVTLICDATQGMGKIKIDVDELGADLLMFSAHKFHGPKGVGILYVRKGIALSATMHGGGHEKGLRSGTLNVPLIIGMAKACELASSNFEKQQQIKLMRDRLEENLLKFPGAMRNGHPIMRVHNVSNISFKDFDANTFISKTTQLALSNGSACTAALFQPSYVLTAMGLDPQEAFGAIRFSLSKYNTIDEVDTALTIIATYLNRPIQYF